MKNFRSVTVLNGNIGEEIQLGRGCRQGDPISGYLFILAVEILILALHANNDILPYRTKKGTAHLCDIYADDLSLFVKKRRSRGQNILQFKTILEILRKFEKLSGLAVNLTKTKIAPFGKNLQLHYLKEATNLDIVTSFKLLGCTFDSTLKNIAENFTKAISAMRKEMYAWSTRKLSVKGKIIVVKTYGISKLNHLAVILPTLNRTHVSELEDLIYKFINPGRAIYPKDLIFRPIEELGLGLQNLNNFWKALKLSWFRQTYNSNSFWLKLLAENTKLANVNNIMFSSMTELRQTFRKYNNPFWTQAFSALEQCSNYLLDTEPKNYLRTNILKNKSITPMITFEHETIDNISLESLINMDKNLHSLATLDKKFPTLFNDWLHFGNFMADSRHYINTHIEQNPDFIPAQTLPTIDYITFFLTRTKKGCKTFYKTLTKSTKFNVAIWSGHKANWEEKLRLTINDDDWKNSIKNIILTKYSNNLVDLNLQILRNNIVTNDRLLKMNKTDSNKCEFCDETDNTLHRFYDCVYSRYIWFTLDEILAMVGIYTFTDAKQCLLGDPDMGPNTVMNFLTFNTKLYLNNCHIHKNKPVPAPYIWYLAKISNTFNDKKVIEDVVDSKTWKKLNNYFNKDTNN